MRIRGRATPLISLLAAASAAAAPAREPAAEAARGLIERIVQKRSSHFVVDIIAPVGESDVFEIEDRDDKIVLRGNNGVAVASALNWYLKYRCHRQAGRSPGGGGTWSEEPQ